jgi:activator of HSP90 ATPase
MFSCFLATNPNNWHWKEKNATQWSKEKFHELLVGLKIDNDELTCEIDALKRCDGEASASNRKAKLFFLVGVRMHIGHRRSIYPYRFVCSCSSTNGISTVNGMDRIVLATIVQRIKAHLP